MQFLKVKNHDLYQHYGTRNPPWVKLYRVIMGDYDLRQVPVSSRLCFVYCTILASETDNRIPFDCDFLTDRMGFKVTEPVITALIDRGLLLASGARRVLATEEKCSSLPTLLLTVSPNPDLQSIPHTKKKSNGLHEFPPDFVLSDEMKTRAVALDLNPFVEFAKFKDHHLSKGSKMKDWQAAWRKWMRTGVEIKEARR